MEKEIKKSELKSVKVNTDIFIRVKELQTDMKKENGYERHITQSEVLEILLDSYEAK